MKVPTLIRLIALILSLGAPLCSGGQWDPIPASAWGIDAKSHPDAKGAVILEDHIRFTIKETERWVRVRIFSDEGFPAADLQKVSKDALVYGQTVYPEGKVTTFEKGKDFAIREVKIGGLKGTDKMVLPPGLNGNCVVDLRWVEPFSYVGSEYFIQVLNHRVLRPFPVIRARIDISDRVELVTAFVGVKNHPPVSSEVEGYHRYEFHNLPALRPIPFALESRRENPTLMGWPYVAGTDEWMKKGIGQFWKMAGEKYLDPDLQRLSEGRQYRALRESIFKDLPSEPSEKARLIHMRLDRSIQNWSEPTFAERAAADKEHSKERIRPRDLEQTAERRRTNGAGMELVFLRLLKDAGLKPRVVYVVDRQNRAFFPAVPNPFQFTGRLIGVESPGRGIAWFSPAKRFIPSGIIHPDYQGTQGMVFEESDRSLKPMVIPAQPAALNQAAFEYDIRIGEIETFRWKARFLGASEYEERHRYMALEPKEQSRVLRERSGADQVYAISKAEVLNAQDPSLNLELQMEGAKELDGGNRLRIQPFPLMPAPVSFPEVWPEERVDPLVLPMNQFCTARSHLVAPPGWRWVKPDPIELKGALGSISWTMSGGGAEVDVVLTVQLDRMVMPATEYQAFRSFMGSLKEVCERTLLLERTP